MKLLNLHCHKIEINLLEYNKMNNPFRKGQISINKNDINKRVKKLKNLDINKSIEIAIPSFDLYIIKCQNCEKISNEYNSEPEQPKILRNMNLGSCFCTQAALGKYSFDNITCFHFFEFNNDILIGTRDEINLYISEKFKSLENNMNLLSLNMKNNENLINSLTYNLNQEKLKNEALIKDKENLGKEKDSLNKNLQKSLLLNSKLKKTIDELNDEQNNAKNSIAKLNSELNSEKKMNQELRNNLDKISLENRENIRKVSEQLETEKSINKNLSANIFELKKVLNEQKVENEESEKLIKEKNSEIQILKKNNNNLRSNIDELKKIIINKENEIQALKETLIKERNNNMNISKNLKSEKEENKKLNDKLDNIAIEYNKNTNEIIKRFDDESKEKDKLIQEKDEELQKERQKNISNNSFLRFKSDCKSGEYDIILHINSIRGLIKDGWDITYNQNEGKQNFLKKKDEPTVVVGVIGNKNMGKTFILEKLSGYIIKKGFNVKTIGLSIRYGTTPQHNIAILDSAGQETPLLNMESSKIKENFIHKEENEVMNESEIEDKENENNKENNEKNNANKKNEDIEDEKDKEFEKYSRDKLITEFFIQKFIIWKADIIVLVVGNISLTEQKLLYTVKQEVKDLNKNQNSNKFIYVIHNLKEYNTEKDVNDYIENTLKKLCKIELEETNQLNILNDNNLENGDYFNKYFIEKNENVAHFIFINESDDQISKYFNVPTIRHIQKEMEVIKTRNKFSVIEDCKEFLINIAGDIMDENIKKENLVIEEGEKCDKILLKNTKEINLKSYAINEVGLTFRNDGDEPKYSCYIDPNKSKLYIHIELPGGGKIKKYFAVKGTYNIFTFEGTKYGDKDLEEDEKNEQKNLDKIANKRKTIKFKFNIEIPCAQIQVRSEEGKSLAAAGSISKDFDIKGIISFEYNVVVINQKKDKNDEEVIDF